MPFCGESRESFISTRELAAWTERHAVWVGLFVLAFLSGLPHVVAVLPAAISFSGLVLCFRNRWTPCNRFGVANAITLFRLCGILMLFCLMAPGAPGAAWVGEAAIGLFILDALDGWAARRWDLVSEFGEYFDKEVDAFFLLVLCMMLYSDQRLGAWVLVPGLLRYFFVGYLKLTRPLRIKEQRTARGRLIYFLVMVSMISAFMADEDFYRPLVVVASLLLCLSFADAVRCVQRGIDIQQESE
jgi:phosphatidylglycerophosphate synthase